MRHLLLLRHGKAAADAGGGDIERALTLRGQHDAGLIGRFLVYENLLPDTAVVSSARRTRETLECVKRELPSLPTIYVEPKLYLAEPDVLLAHLRRTPPSTGTLLAIGHNPGYAELAVALSGFGDMAARNRMLHKFPTCALAVISFETDWAQVKPGAGRLERHVVPAELRADG